MFFLTLFEMYLNVEIKLKKNVNLILSGEDNVEILMKELYLTSYSGGFVNGAIYELFRPNTFITPQGRVAEYLFFSTLSEVLHEIDPKRKVLHTQ